MPLPVSESERRAIAFHEARHAGPLCPLTKKTGDKGIDGRMYFETKEGLKCMVLSVKGGGIRPTDLRDLRGVLERDHDMTWPVSFP